METLDRRRFLGKAWRWTLGFAALGLAGSLASCASDGGTTATVDGDTASGSNSDNTSGGTQVPSAASTTTAVVTSRCVGCGKCTRGACDQGAISMSVKKAVISDACIGCGDCVKFCPAGAIVLVQSSGGTAALDPGDTDGPFTAALQASQNQPAA